MIGAVIVTQGDLARVLLDATQRIVGSAEAIRAVTIGWDDETSAARQQIAAAIAEVSSGCGVILFTDVFGGTPTNVSLTFLEPGEVEIITGVNLPMVVKLVNLQGSDAGLLEIVSEVRDRGQKSIYVASEILSSQESS